MTRQARHRREGGASPSRLAASGPNETTAQTQGSFHGTVAERILIGGELKLGITLAEFVLAALATRYGNQAYWALDRYFLGPVFLQPTNWLMDAITRGYGQLLRWALRLVSMFGRGTPPSPMNGRDDHERGTAASEAMR